MFKTVVPLEAFRLGRESVLPTGLVRARLPGPTHNLPIEQIWAAAWCRAETLIWAPGHGCSGLPNKQGPSLCSSHPLTHTPPLSTLPGGLAPSAGPCPQGGWTVTVTCSRHPPQGSLTQSTGGSGRLLTPWNTPGWWHFRSGLPLGHLGFSGPLNHVPWGPHLFRLHTD